MADKNVSVRVSHFKLANPVINIDDTDDLKINFYSYKFFEAFLNEIIKSPHPEYKKDDSKYIELINLKQSSDANIVEGYFHSTRYGTENDIINTTTKAVVSKLGHTDGVKNVINFVINRKTGYMIIQTDPIQVVTRNFMAEYFNNKAELGKSLITEFNIQNKPYLIADSFLFTLTSVNEEDFWEQLKKLNRIKELKIKTTVEKSDNNSALFHLMNKSSNKEENKLDGISSVEYVVKNEIRNSGLSHVEKFVKNLIDFEKVSTIRAEGYNEQGKQDKALFSIVPKTTFIITTKNDKGTLDQSKLINGLIASLKKHE